jgi:trigger factor
MQVSVEQLDGLMRQVTVTIPCETVDGRYGKKIKQVAATAKVPGFRPGKVPSNVIERQYGGSVRQEVLSEVMDESFRNALEQESIRMAGMPTVEPLKEYKTGEPFEYVVKFETYPEITLQLLDGETVEPLSAELTDEDQAKMLEKLREQNAEWVASDNPAQRGDKVVIDFEGFMDGEAFEGGSAKDYELELGSQSMIPGFEDGLLAASFGDETVLKLKFPEEYHAKELAGKDTEFKVKVKQVLRRESVTDDAELAKKIGFESQEELVKKIQDTMKSELERAINNNKKEKILDMLLEKHDDVLVPGALVDEEVKHLQKMALQQMSGGQSIEGLDLSKLNLPVEPYMDEAKKRVKLGLLLAEAIKHFEIKADQDKVRARVEEVAAMYPNPEQVVEWYFGNREALSEIESAVIEDAVVEQLAEKMVVNQKSVSYDELMNPQKDESEEDKGE